MEYIYAALLLHKAGQKVDENSVKKVLEAAGVKAEDGRVKSLVAALDGVNIEESIKAAAIAPVAAEAPAAKAEAPAAKKEEKKEEVKEEQAAAGLGSLFG